MEIIVSPNSFNNAINLINENVDIILLTNSKFGVRNQYDCNNQELKQIVDYAKNKQTKIWVNINSFFFENQLNSLEQYLNFINKLNIDTVVFNDMSVAQYHYENKYNFNLHYDPNTLITSYGQLNFYCENNIKSISLSNELFLNEVNNILLNKPTNIKICIQAHGHSFIMHSRWNLITNFKEYINDINDEYVKNKVYYIKELDRKFSNIIYEDLHGTHMLSGYELCLIEYLDILIKHNLDYIRIDGLLQNNDYCLNIYKIYKQAIEYIQNNNYDNDIKKELYNQCLMFSKNKLISSGFIGGVESIKNYEKK